MKIIIIFLPLLCISMLSCKKGKEDPAFSLRSRDARLAGNWKLQEGNIIVKTVESSGATQELKYRLDGSQYHVDVTGLGTIDGVHTTEIAITADGTFTCTETIDKYQAVQKGQWDFLARSGTYKNRERVMFNLGSLGVNSFYIDAFNKGNSAFAYALRKLSKDEMIMECADEFISSVDGKTSYYLTSWFRFRH